LLVLKACRYTCSMMRIAHPRSCIIYHQSHFLVQAANASDFAIGRFRFLQRLLLVHGRWNYHRMARLVLYSFSKNILFVACQFWYSYLTLWSGEKVSSIL
jgi:hypothetical protein